MDTIVNFVVIIGEIELSYVSVEKANKNTSICKNIFDIVSITADTMYFQ